MTAPAAPNAGQVPMTEEFDNLKHTMPNTAPMVVAMLLVLVVLGVLIFAFRSKPVVSGSIDDVVATTVPGQNSSLALVNLSFRNDYDKTLRLVNLSITVHAKGTDFRDEMGSVADFPRYTKYFPALAQHAQEPLARDTRYAPRQKASGSVIVAFPLTQEEFDNCDSLTATMIFDNYPAVKIVSKKK